MKKQFLAHNLNDLCDIGVPISKAVIKMSFLPSVLDTCVSKWKDELSRETGKNGKGGNKLRTYRLFKNEYEVEEYCTQVWSVRYRGALAKFRTGTAPLRIETGRYELLPVNERRCFNCNAVEDELHVLIHCPLYEDIRCDLFNNAISVCDMFNYFTDIEKMCYILSNPNIVKDSAKTCWLILERRKLFLTT